MKWPPPVVEVDEARQNGIRGNLHSEVDNPIKYVAKGMVLASSRLDDPPVLGHVDSHKVQLQTRFAPRDLNASWQMTNH
jgi:hypothetical protein